MNPQSWEPSGLEFADRKFIELLNRTRTNPERLPIVHRTGRTTCDKSIRLRVSCREEIINGDPTLPDGFGCNQHEGYLLTKYRGKHYILPRDGLESAGSLCVTFIAYDHQ